MNDPLRDIAQKDEKLLATLGYKQELKREFSPLEVFGVAFSIIGLIPSMSSVLVFAVANGGGPTMVWGWSVASLFIIFVGMAVAELGSAAPTSGGLYFWTYSLASPRWKTLLCWIVGYSNTVGSVAGVASIDWGCAVQIMAAATIGSNGAFEPSAAQLYALYAAIVLSHGVVCSLGTALLARLQTVYIILNVLLSLAVIIALPAATPSEFRNTAKVALWDFQNFQGWSNGYAFILSFLAPLWTICSFDGTVHLSEEASNAATAVPWAIVGSIVVSAVLGLAVNLSLAFCMGNDLTAIANSPQPMAHILANSLGQKGTLTLWSMIVLAQYMMGSSVLLASSRQTFAFSRDGGLPFSGWLYRINRSTNTPVHTVWFVAFLSTLLGLLSFAGDQAISAVFTTSITSLYIAYTIPISCRFLGNNDFIPGPYNLGVFGFPVAVIAVLFMMFMSIVFLFPSTPHPGVADMNYTIVVLGGVLAVSILWYYLPKYGGVHWFTGPVRTIDTHSSRDSSNSDEDNKKEVTVETKQVV